ncbi:gluconokinase [Georgenia yuyongxinii]|uniref:Sugar kinase n=1 Tax=Georgenia yuyongxinii TaxID=2589797 RepID=A0A552WMG3_9MICO|nr:gluconokinase [Georgenia yuyongxinii]TRW43956.1 sugar kinase [Georgenia yuyongxinii]
MGKHGIVVDPDQAREPFVLALDVGSTASRGGLYDAAGRPVRGLRHKVPHQFATAADGTAEIDPEQVVAELAEIITEVTGRRRGLRVAGVALDTFASSLVGVDDAGTALTPCYTYADSRCAPQLRALRAELDEPAIQQRTGTRLHTSYLPARLRWLRESAPAVFGRTSRWLSLGEYVHLRLLGTAAVGTSTAAWTGMLDRRTGVWDAKMLAVAGVDVAQLSQIHDPDRPLEDHGGAGGRWPALADAVWLAPVTDGFASNIGIGANDEATIAAAAATSGAMRVMLPGHPETIPAGLWSYRVDASRTLLGGALNDVGRVVSWLDHTLALDAPDTAALDRDAALLAAPDAAAPVVLPYLTGERSTGWAADARALFADVSAATTAPLLYRGAMEGVALAYARVAEQLKQAGGRPQRILASGRVTMDLPGWLQILADVLGAPVEQVTMKRTTMHGTALLALDVVAPGVERAAVEIGASYEPQASRAAYYEDRAARYQRLYDAVVAPHH